MELSKNIKRLPDALKLYILSFHANTQPEKLLEDIKHYNVSRNRLKDIYDNRWREFSHIYPQIDDWLDNDLVYHLTSGPTMFGYQGAICGVLKRYFNYNSETCFKFLKSKNSTFVSNTIWGLLTLSEREDFIECQE